MFCTECGKKGTKNRTVNPLTKICSDCDTTNNANDELEEHHNIPENIAHKSGAELSATEIYTIVTSAMQVTNKKIDDLQKDVQNKIGTLENKVKFLENEN